MFNYYLTPLKSIPVQALSPTYANSLAFKFISTSDQWIKWGNNFSKDRTDPWTYVYWIKRDAGGTTNFAMGKWDTGISRGIASYFIGDDLYLYIRSTATTNELVVHATNVISGTTNYYQVIVSYDGSSTPGGVSMWVTQAGTAGARSLKTLTTDTNNLSATIVVSSDFTIGGYGSGLGNVTGKIAEAALFNVAFNQTDANATVDGSGNPIDLRTHSKVNNLELYSWCGDAGDNVQTVNGVNSHLLASNPAIGTGNNMTNASNIVAYP